MISPDGVSRLFRSRVDQNYGALEVVQKRFVGELFGVRDESFVDVSRLIRIAAALEKDHGLSHLDMLRLPRLQASNHHDRAKHKQQQKAQDVSIMAEEPHMRGLST